MNKNGGLTFRISWPVLALGLVLAAIIVAALLEIGPPTSSARTSKELVTAADGLVQSTVTGTGNVEPATDVTGNFQTSGTLQNLYVTTGEHVIAGQLLATLDPTAAQLALDQAQENLVAAQDNLTNAENAAADASSSSSSTTTTASTDVDPGAAQFVSYRPDAVTATTPARTGHPATTTTVTVTVPARTPTRTRTTTTQTSTTTTTTPRRTTAPTRTTSTTTTSAPSGSSSRTSGSTGSSSTGSSGTSGGTTTTNTLSLDASVAQAEGSVDSAEAAVRSAQNTLDETHLYAPATGTVISVEAISPGDTVSGSSSASSGSSSTGSSSTGSSATGSASTGSSAAGSLGGSSSSTGSSSSSSSSSTGFVEIVDTGSMTMTVAFSESDISKVKVGQPATVTLDALTGVELAARVTAISTLGTTSSSVVSYDATLTIDQHDSQVRPGMSASASVITGQASGVNLPTSAVTGSSGTVATVNVMKNGKVVPTQVVVGVVGDSRTQIVSGLKAGQQVQVTETLPSLGTSTASSGSSSTGTLGGTSSRFGGAGGGAAFFRGGG
jgi:multidrug efflux pump subunit AcrA (membrane-fusion protein)